MRTETTHAPAVELLRAALDATTEAVLVCAADDHSIVLMNTAARTLLPGAPSELPLPTDTDTFTGTLAGRAVQGSRRPLGAGHYGWFLREAAVDRTAFLAEAGRRLSASLHHGRCVRTTVELAAAHLADAAVLVLPARHRRSEWMRLVDGGSTEEGLLVEKALGEVPGLQDALGGFPPIPSRWLDASQVPEWLLGAGFGPVGALLVTALPGNGEPAGALILARRGPDAAFSTDDEMLARIFAARAGGAISAAGLYREQADTVAILQADLLPPELPEPEGVELIGSYQAAKDALRISGDFYDVFGPTADNPDTVVVLGDVCGKGPEAAVLTGKIRQTLRALHLVGAEPGAMLRVLNRALLDSSRRHRFATLVVGAISRGDHGRVRIGLASGGHPAPLILRADGTVETAPVSGTLIGAVPEITVRPATIELAPGELCLMYSDGLTEARGGATGTEQYGEDRLRDALAGCHGIPGPAAVERIRQLVSDWVHGGVRDDIAMLAVRAPSRTRLSLMESGQPATSPFAIDARRGDRRVRARS